MVSGIKHHKKFGLAMVSGIKHHKKFGLAMVSGIKHHKKFCRADPTSHGVRDNLSRPV